jgi:hypothetical protein
MIAWLWAYKTIGSSSHVAVLPSTQSYNYAALALLILLQTILEPFSLQRFECAEILLSPSSHYSRSTKVQTTAPGQSRQSSHHDRAQKCTYFTGSILPTITYLCTMMMELNPSCRSGNAADGSMAPERQAQRHDTSSRTTTMTASGP